ncbi:hypothetical protein RIR_jg17600.t1 [Rhizophagus irregularis DAOM 181602=DAOM 197198]|nr:hypothetical protein RIR_jg17600.t1 [Rhizophagus irregularis DAOM 181602=DAOM 197198]
MHSKKKTLNDRNNSSALNFQPTNLLETAIPGIPVQSETDLKKHYLTYKAQFEAEFPEEFSLTLNYIHDLTQCTDIIG